jgi:hypothetical protein
VTGLTLINTDNGKSLGALVEGETIDLGKLGTSDLTVIATPNPAVVGSVVFGYDSTPLFHVENKSPYAFDGKISSGSSFVGYYAWTPTLGKHTIKATPFSGTQGTGTAGTPLAVDFTVANSGAPVTSTSTTIQVSITNPTNGESQAGPGYYVIRTSTSDSSGSVSKVSFYVNGNLLGTADAQPFSMAWENASAGSYTLTAVASDSKGSKTSSPVKVTITSPTSPHTYYVSTTGNNANNGLSASSAFKTISDAANIAQPGDTVMIEPGTYREEVKVPHGGTATAPITFKAVKSGTVIIDGADPLGGWTKNSGSNPVFTTAWNHDFFWSPGVRFYGGFTTDGSTTTVGYAEQFLYNGSPLLQVLSLSAVKAGDFYVNYSSHTVSVWLPSGATPSSSNMLGSDRSHLFYPASTSVEYVRVDGLIMQHAANFSQNQAVQTATGWRITNSTVQWVSAGAIGIHGSDVLLVNDHALHNGQTGIGGTGTNDLFVHDETAYNNYKQFSCFHEAGGGKFAQSDGLYFDQYYAHNNIGPGLWFDVGNANYVVVNGYFYDNVGRVANYEGVGILLEISDGPGRIENNTLYSNTGASLDICESMNVTAEHNTFANSYLEVRDETDRAPHHLGNIVILDNSFLDAFICTSLGIWNNSSGSTKHITIDGDIFDDTGNLYYWAGGAYKNLSTIFSTLGFEKNAKLGTVSLSAAPSVI